jgi:signal transduction protein with GAF and PtsI domain
MAKKTKTKSSASGSQKGAPKKTGAKAGKAGSVKADAGASSFEAQLRSAVRAVEVADTLTTPLTKSIENLLKIASQAVNSDAASVLVRDGEEGGLKFLIATGEVADKLSGVRIPPGKGIAGFVFASGQPMAVDVSQEEQFFPDVDRLTGYRTLMTLATPLRVAGEAVGVLQFVNRPGEPPYEIFSPEEMERAAYFADAIAALVDARETAGLVESLFEHSVKSATDASAGKSDTDEVRAWLDEVRTAPEHRDLMALAITLRDVAERGDAERQLCREVLDALSRYTEKSGAAGMTYMGF